MAEDGSAGSLQERKTWSRVREHDSDTGFLLTTYMHFKVFLQFLPFVVFQACPEFLEYIIIFLNLYSFVQPSIYPFFFFFCHVSHTCHYIEYPSFQAI